MPLIHRRALITGLVSLIAAPAIVKAGSLMPVKAMEWGGDGQYHECTCTWNGDCVCGPDLNEASLERVLIEIRRWHPRGLRITTPRQIRT